MPSASNRPLSNCEREIRSVVSNSGELDGAVCPICLEHPHNAVLLQCSSGNLGCRSYICNTSTRHSNCLGNFLHSTSSSSTSRNLNSHNQSKFPPCPLCRGDVRGWLIDQKARAELDLKVRACTFHDCEFTGSYKQLRSHARKDHPSVRPSVAEQIQQENRVAIPLETDPTDMVVEEYFGEGSSGQDEEVGYRRIQMTYTRNNTNTGEPPQVVSATVTLPQGAARVLSGASIVITTQYSGRASGVRSNSISDIEILYENSQQGGADEGRNVREHSRRYSRNRRSRRSNWSSYRRSR